MKRNIFCCALLALALVGCSSSDSSSSDDTPGGNPSNYFETEVGNYWVYDVTGRTEGRDSLYVAQTISEQSNVFQLLKTKEAPVGFYTGLLNETKLRSSNGKIMVSGAANFEVIPNFPLAFSISDFILFQDQGSNNQVLSTVNGVYNTEYEGTPLQFDYSIKSIFVKKHASLTIPQYGQEEEVVEINLIVNLKITAFFTINVSSNPIPVVLMNNQDVVNSKQYYVASKGSVLSSTTINYQLEDLSNFIGDLPFENTGSFEIFEKLVRYKE